MQFQQAPPALGNQYEDDRVLRSYLLRVLPKDVLRDVEESLTELGRLSGAELYEFQLADRLNEPTLTQWDAWGNRVDKVELTPLWRLADRIAAEHGVVATAYEQRHGSLSRVHQCALAYLFTPSTDIYSCPLAMTDGAARTLQGYWSRRVGSVLRRENCRGRVGPGRQDSSCACAYARIRLRKLDAPISGVRRSVRPF